VWAEAVKKVHEYFPYIEDGEVPFVAHNKAFDENCLKAVFRAYDIAYPDYAFECTLLRSRKVWPGGHHNLDIIAGYCGYDMTNHHHALADAEACAIIAKQIL
jgi:DNA polymerase-3 subunit epsilon